MKNSKQRDLILSIVRENDIHPTAEWVYGEAKKHMPKIGVATVYRNLNLLVEMGELNRIVVPGGPDRFDGQPGEHYHMMDADTSEIIDLFPKNEETMENLKEAFKEAFALEDFNFIVDGTLLTALRKN